MMHRVFPSPRCFLFVLPSTIFGHSWGLDWVGVSSSMRVISNVAAVTQVKFLDNEFGMALVWLVRNISVFDSKRAPRSPCVCWDQAYWW